MHTEGANYTTFDRFYLEFLVLKTWFLQTYLFNKKIHIRSEDANKH